LTATSEYPELVSDPEDTETNCSLAKTIRIRIAAEYPDILKYNGLSPREYSAEIRWQNLSPAEQQEIKERGKKQLKCLAGMQGTSGQGEMTYISEPPQNGKISIPVQ
jgi:hypothetical protein